MVAAAQAARDDLTLVTRAPGVDGAGALTSSGRPDVTAGGGEVLFESTADNLSTDDNDGRQNLFVRDVAGGSVDLVSRASGFGGAAADTGDSFDATISEDGRYVAFASNANNLSDIDADSATNVFRRDRSTGATTLVSRADGDGGAPAAESSYESSISPDGRYVAFVSNAANVSPDDNDLVANVFLRDVEGAATTFVNRATDGTAANSDCLEPSVSADGRFVVFQSRATNLVNDPTNGVLNVYVRDTVLAQTFLVSRATGAGGAPGNGDSQSAAISSDGRYVAFSSDASNLSGGGAARDVFVRDLVAQETTLISRADGAGGIAGNAASTNPDISSGGRYVTFASDAGNLSDADRDAVGDVFLRDRQLGRTFLVSRAAGADGAAADAGSREPAISGDGLSVAFTSDADNLNPAASRSAANIYIRDVLGPVATPVVPAPAPVTPAPPVRVAGPPSGMTPAPIVVSGLRISPVRWRSSHLVGGTVTGQITATRAGAVLVNLLGRNGHVVGSQRIPLGVGDNALRIPLRSNALPGPVTLSVRAQGLAVVRAPVGRISAPPEGIVRRVSFGDGRRVQLARLSPRSTTIVARFSFTVLPVASLRSRVTFRFRDPTGATTVTSEPFSRDPDRAITVPTGLRRGPWVVSLSIGRIPLAQRVIRVG